ncbi:MAG: hypothetical protein EOO56_06600 [Hymenobacter sp.]|nr:MAG: hypothetical protein EOO56_06600 [Hymenobacter sp.]
MPRLLRSLLPVLVLGLLAGCTVYDSVFHPRRLASPDVMSAKAKAKFKASEKARHRGQVLKSEEAPAGPTDPNAPAGSEDKKDSKLTYSELPEGTKAKYDKQLLLKKPKYKRRRYHRYDTRPLTPNDVSRENRRLRKHPKGQARDQDAPATSGREAAPEAEQVQEPKERKSKKAPVPKPDPTAAPGTN